MEIYVLALIVGLQVKHFVADYLLQTGWMIAGKKDLAAGGGYAHVGVHVLGTALVLVFTGIPVAVLALVLVAEGVIHYAIDYGKAAWSSGKPSDVTSRAFWAAHGADQFAHQLTYAAIVFAVLFFA